MAIGGFLRSVCVREIPHPLTFTNSESSASIRAGESNSQGDAGIYMYLCKYACIQEYMHVYIYVSMYLYVYMCARFESHAGDLGL